MNSDNIKEQSSPKPVIARQKGKLGAVMIDPKTGKPIPDTWIPKDKVPQSALKYLDPEKFSAAERRNADRQAQIDAEKQRLKGVGNPPAPAPAPAPAAEKPSSAPAAQTPAPKPAVKPAPSPAPKIERSPSGYAVGTAPGGVKFERRAATRAELEAAQAARKAAQDAGKSKAEVEKSAISAGVSASKKPVKEQTMMNDAYDLVLEYLFSQGHVDTVEEAHYVMLEMDSEFIHNIISESSYSATNNHY